MYKTMLMFIPKYPNANKLIKQHNKKIYRN
jgi:hypothetical protein